MFGDADPTVLAALASVTAELEALAAELNSRSSTRWKSHGLEVATYPGPPVKRSLSGSVLGGTGDDLAYVNVQIDRGDYLAGSDRDPTLWYVEGDVHADWTGEPDDDGQMHCVFALPDRAFPTPLAAAQGLVSAARELREVARTRPPTPAGWRSMRT